MSLLALLSDHFMVPKIAKYIQIADSLSLELVDVPGLHLCEQITNLSISEVSLKVVNLLILKKEAQSLDNRHHLGRRLHTVKDPKNLFNEEGVLNAGHTGLNIVQRVSEPVRVLGSQLLHVFFIEESESIAEEGEDDSGMTQLVKIQNSEHLTEVGLYYFEVCILQIS